MDSNTYTTSGLVATTPRHIVTQDGLAITSFRLAATVTTSQGNSETNWFTVSTYRELAINVASSISKGQRIVVTGKLRVRDWDNGDTSGTSVEIEADALGHDLSFGIASFTRNVLVRGAGIEPSREATPEVTPEDVPAPTPAHSCNCRNCNQ